MRGGVLKRIEIEVAAILARSEERSGNGGGRRHKEDWQEHGRGANGRWVEVSAAQGVRAESAVGHRDAVGVGVY